MPIDPWDVTTPADGDFVSQGDDRIREMKRALNERLERLFNNWPDGDDTLTVKRAKIEPAVKSVEVGLLAARPVAAGEGNLYYAADKQMLYISYESSPGVWEWRVSRAIVQHGTDFPYPLAEAPDGILFYNTDTKVLYMAVVGTGWIPIYNGSTTAGLVTYADWQNAGAVGAKITNPAAVRKLVFKGGGTTTAGVFAMPLSEFAAYFNLSRFRAVMASARESSSGAPLITYAIATAADIEIHCRTDAGVAFAGTISFTAEIAYVPE